MEQGPITQSKTRTIEAISGEQQERFLTEVISPGQKSSSSEDSGVQQPFLDPLLDRLYRPAVQNMMGQTTTTPSYPQTSSGGNGQEDPSSFSPDRLLDPQQTTDFQSTLSNGREESTTTSASTGLLAFVGARDSGDSVAEERNSNNTTSSSAATMDVVDISNWLSSYSSHRDHIHSMMDEKNNEHDSPGSGTWHRGSGVEEK